MQGQDSNLRPPAYETGGLTELPYPARASTGVRTRGLSLTRGPLWPSELSKRNCDAGDTSPGRNRTDLNALAAQPSGLVPAPWLRRDLSHGGFVALQHDKIKWGERRGSNPHRTGPQPAALTASATSTAPPGGIEPPAVRLTIGCSASELRGIIALWRVRDRRIERRCTVLSGRRRHQLLSSRADRGRVIRLGRRAVALLGLHLAGHRKRPLRPSHCLLPGAGRPVAVRDVCPTGESNPEPPDPKSGASASWARRAK